MDLIVSSEIFTQLDTQFKQICDSPSQASDLLEFGRQVLELSPIEELDGQPVKDVAGFLFSLRDYVAHRDVDTPKVSVFNPSLEEDGWKHRYTHVFVLQKNMAFLVDSVLIALNRKNLSVYDLNSIIFNVERDGSGNLVSFAKSGADADAADGGREALIYFRIDRFSDPDALHELSMEIADILRDVESVNQDYHPCLGKMDDVINEVRRNHGGINETHLAESIAFLEWLKDDRFTFLGYSCYQIKDGDDPTLHHMASEQLGVFRTRHKKIEDQKVSSLASGFKAFYQSDLLLALTKSSRRSRVHRDSYCDYVVVKRFDDKGKLIGEHRFLGLYTSRVYAQNPFDIPLVREKLHKVYQRSKLEPMSHGGKDLRQIMETYPRDELFHATYEQLYDILVDIWQIKQRKQVRLFIRPDMYERFVSCMIYFPRDIFHSEIRLKTEKLLGEAFEAIDSQFTTYFDESLLARTHLIFRVDSNAYKKADVNVLQEKIIGFTRDWRDDLCAEIIDHWGDEAGRDIDRHYHSAFPVAYQEIFDPRVAVQDIEMISGLDSDSPIALNFYEPPHSSEKHVAKLKIFHLGAALELSELVPIIENLGFRVLGEHPYTISPMSGEKIWMHEFTLRFGLDVDMDISAVRSAFESAFLAIWSGQSENDSFNNLVVGARLDWRSVALLRVYARYMKQIGNAFSQDFIASTLAGNLDVTRNLVALFKSNFLPRPDGKGSTRDERLVQKILDALDQVANLNQDRILRNYLSLIRVTVRTNFYRVTDDGEPLSYISLKLMPGELDILPRPRPSYEVFVYSPRIEGVHLRTSKVARGGLRWSDRLEDYRTEILGLVKAQTVKNSVIVPSGAKGGFVAKQIPVNATREQIQEEGVACYKLFIQGLLDVTDNLVKGDLVPPPNVVRLDDDDPYLVVAADKGTATFSDLANSISENYSHWLGDAFASGGSNGYDHKKMGITARGAWVAVQRHFREFGLNTQEDPFTVIGVGDMGGDVFGNGMLLSDKIKLVAAFNHLAIFIDPDPDPAASFAERKRLFEMPRSSWSDYDESLISKGGGVFSRASKSISLTPEIQTLIETSEDTMTPSQLINALLKAPVDLIWNGGIGTYVKGSRESNPDVGDKANDELRVNGRDLRCRVFGEGGNLGMTQRGRIEFCANGGACNTDFIDNAGGVDCSDVEVNIKIALNQLIEGQDITPKQRNIFLESMTDEVADLVLLHNYRQTLGISLAKESCKVYQGAFVQVLKEWENSGLIDRELEGLPSDEELADRLKNAQTLFRPELAILVSHAKIQAKQALVEDPIIDDPFFEEFLFRGFPSSMTENYGAVIENHRLRREITANQIANDMVDRMSLSVFRRQQNSTGSTYGEVARAYVITRDVFDLDGAWEAIEALDYKMPYEQQATLFLILMRLGRRATRWMLRNRRDCDNISAGIRSLREPMQKILSNAAKLSPMASDQLDRDLTAIVKESFTGEHATLLRNGDGMFFALGIADACQHTGFSVEDVSRVYQDLRQLLEIDWFSDQILALPVSTRWEDYARESYMDELENGYRALAIGLIEKVKAAGAIPLCVPEWQKSQASLISRWQDMVYELRSAPSRDFAMFSVAIKELNDLVTRAVGDTHISEICAIGE